jgi:putative methyltransferase (TIGR04325 family)
MTDVSAYRLSLWRAASRAWVKQLARTTIGSKILRAAYEGHFEAAGGYERLFRGLYPDFASAAAAAPPGKQVGYNGDATTTRRAHEWRYIFPSDYPVLFWLSRLIPGTSLLFDLGGDIGSRYLAFRKHLIYPDNFTWLVNDIPSIVALGRTIAQEEAAPHLQFTTDYTRVAEADILLASGVLQVLEDWNGFLQRAASLPRHVLINRTPVGNQPGAVTLSATGVSFAPYRIFNRRSFIAAFVDLGYRLVDEWLTPGFDCRIPDHASHSLDAFSGFYFVLEPSRPKQPGASVTELENFTELPPKLEVGSQ